jgi:hypothetical protein
MPHTSLLNLSTRSAKCEGARVGKNVIYGRYGYICRKNGDGDTEELLFAFNILCQLNVRHVFIYTQTA